MSINHGKRSEKVPPFEEEAGNVNGAPASSDEALALRFTGQHANDWKYVDKRGVWLCWTGQRWKPEETLHVIDLIRANCREAAIGCEKREAGKIASAKTVRAVEQLARADRRHAASIDDWDADPWLLNTPDGTVELQSGHVREHSRSDFLTKIAAASPGGDCPTWREFLYRVTDGNAELCSFLQRVAGYGLTGNTREHALFFCYGTGANGKSVFLNTLAGMAGDYHRTAPMEAFTATRNERHSTELAMLRGARLVTAIETEEGRHWAESRIKSLTGGDKVAARFMRQDYFEFIPQFKLLIAGNHKPSLRSVDEAIRRRLHLIPFTVTIPAEERDPDLSDKLKAEWPGIMAWAIEGALLWQERGLDPPKRVREATEDYLSEEDTFAAWLEDCTEENSACWEQARDLFQSWERWAEASGEYVGSERAFSQTLLARGFKRARRRTGREYLGLQLKRHDYTEDLGCDSS